MDEMNQLENQLQSWTPRRPSPEIARRLFAPARRIATRPRRRAGAWSWLSPVAACVLTMLVVVHTASRAPARLAQGSNGTFFATLMLNAACGSNMATYSLNQTDENLEWNIWPHATHDVALSPRAQAPLRRDVWPLVPTNR
jgi:hypothetical protein